MGKFSKILVPLDGSNNSNRGLDKAIDFEQDLAVACDVMIKNKINGIGVKINGKLGGIVSKTDVLKAIHIENSSK